MSAVDRQAFATMVGVLAAVFLALWAGFEQPSWAGISALIIANVDQSELVTKGVLRVAGTIAGVVIGYYGAVWMQGAPLMEALAMVVAAGIGTYGRLRSSHGYAWFYGALTILLVLSCSLTTPEDLHRFAFDRGFEIVTGVVAATAASWALGPGAGALPAHLVAHPSSVPHDTALRVSFAAGVGTLAVVLVWSAFDLPVLTQVLASSLIVIDADAAQSRLRSLQRIIGCLIGGVAGLIVIGIDPSDQMWWTIALGGGIWLFARVHLGGTANAYIGTQSAVAFVITLVDTGPPASLLPPVNRLLGIVIGVSIISVVVWAITQRPRGEAVPAAAPGGATPPPRSSAGAYRHRRRNSR